MAKVLFIAPIYNYYPILVHALQLQTHRDWELLLIHDGPNATGLRALMERLGDPRIRYYESVRRFDDWGHSLRAMGLQAIAAEPIEGDFVIITNADNYYAPPFVEYMLGAIDTRAVAAYCPVVHSHRKWTTIDSELRHQFIDCGCVMARRDAALEVGWASREHSADWVYIDAMVRRFGKDGFRKIPNVLFVHN